MAYQSLKGKVLHRALLTESFLIQILNKGINPSKVRFYAILNISKFNISNTKPRINPSKVRFYLIF